MEGWNVGTLAIVHTTEESSFAARCLQLKTHTKDKNCKIVFRTLKFSKENSYRIRELKID